MTNYVSFGDIVEENGKTIRENNQEKVHNIPVGTLVEVEYSSWFGGGACERVQARLWVHSHGRDCDGTPLYVLSQKPPREVKPSDPMLYFPGEEDELHGYATGSFLKREVTQATLDGHRSGFHEDSLKVVEVTDDLRRGKGALSWNKDGEN